MFTQRHPRSSSSSLLFPLYSDRPFALPLAKHIEDLEPWDPRKYSFHGVPGTTGLLPLLDQRLFPWWEMWEEFCALVLVLVHFKHGAWKLATRVVLWVWEANCPVFNSESRLLSMSGEGQNLQKKVLTKASTVFLNKNDTWCTTNFSWSSFKDESFYLGD